MAKRKTTSKTFVKELRTVGGKYPELAGKYALARVKKRPSARAAIGELRCVQWGEDPVTGKRVCLRWEKA